MAAPNPKSTGPQAAQQQHAGKNSTLTKSASSSAGGRRDLAARRRATSSCSRRRARILARAERRKPAGATMSASLQSHSSPVACGARISQPRDLRIRHAVRLRHARSRAAAPADNRAASRASHGSSERRSSSCTPSSNSLRSSSWARNDSSPHGSKSAAPSGASGLKIVSVAGRQSLLVQPGISEAFRPPRADQPPRDQPPGQRQPRPGQQRRPQRTCDPAEAGAGCGSSSIASSRNQATASRTASAIGRGRLPAEFAPRLRVAEELAAPRLQRRLHADPRACSPRGVSRSATSPAAPITRTSPPGRQNAGGGRSVSSASWSRKSFSHRFSWLIR